MEFKMFMDLHFPLKNIFKKGFDRRGSNHCQIWPSALIDVAAYQFVVFKWPLTTTYCSWLWVQIASLWAQVCCGIWPQCTVASKGNKCKFYKVCQVCLPSDFICTWAEILVGRFKFLNTLLTLSGELRVLEGWNRQL